MNRIQSVDVVRLVAITFVIAIHTSPFHDMPCEINGTYKWLSVLIDQLARFVMPFFFTISGYFWGKRVNEGESPFSASSRTLKRILPVFLAWSLLYALPYNVGSIPSHGMLGPIRLAYRHLGNVISDPLTLLMQGTKIHLWFLVAIVFALGITSVFVHHRLEKSLIVFAFVLYLLGTSAKAYSGTPVGLSIDFDTQKGPFFGTLPFVTGYWLSKYNPNARWLLKGIVVLAVGCSLHFSELYLLWKWYGIDLYPDYVLGTYLMGLGVAIISLSNPPWLASKRLAAAGRYTLGVYAIHYMYAEILLPIDRVLVSPAWELGYIFIVLILSLVSVRMMSKNRILRRIVC